MRYLMILLIGLTANIATAEQISIPNNFSAGEKAIAADVNSNFNAVAVGVNNNDNEIKNNTVKIESNTSSINGKQNTLSNAACGAGNFINNIAQDGNVTCSTPNATLLAFNSVGSSELQANSVNSLDHIIDEAGITNEEKGCVETSIGGTPIGCKPPNFSLSTSPQEISSVTINAPADGFVFLSFSSSYQFLRRNSTDEVVFHIEINQSTTPTIGSNETGALNTLDTNGSYRVIYSAIGISSGLVANSIHSQIKIPIQAGTQTFYVYGFANSDNKVSIKSRDLSAMYFPTTY